MGILFDADNDRVTIADSVSIQDTPALTRILWVYPKILGNGKYICRKTANSGENTELIQIASNNWGGAWGNGYWGSTGGPLQTDKWTILADSWQVSSQPLGYTGIYPNKAVQVSYAYRATPTASADDASNDLIIGNNLANLTKYFDGIIAWACFYKAKLTLDQINLQAYNPGVNCYSNCILRMFLGSNGLNTQVDYSGYGNTGTVTGSSVDDNMPVVPWRYIQGNLFKAKVDINMVMDSIIRPYVNKLRVLDY